LDKSSKYSLVSFVQFIVQVVALIANLTFVKNEFISSILLTLIFIIPEIVAGVIRNGIVSNRKFNISLYSIVEFIVCVFSISAFFIPLGYLDSILPASSETVTGSITVSLVLVMLSIVIMLVTIISKLSSSIDRMFE